MATASDEDLQRVSRAFGLKPDNGWLGSAGLGAVDYVQPIVDLASDPTGAKAAEQQQGQIRDSANRLRTLGGQAGQFYANSRQNAQNRYGAAQSAYSGYQAPNYSRSAYSTVAARQGLGGGYGYPQPTYQQPSFRSSTPGATNSWQTYGGPTLGGGGGFSTAGSRAGAQSFGSYPAPSGGSLGGGMGGGGYGGGGYSTNTQGYYNTYRAPTGAQSYAAQRAATGYGPNQVVDRYSARASSQAPQNLAGEMGSFRDLAYGQTSSGGLMGTLQGQYARPEALDGRLGARQQFASAPSMTAGALGRLNDLDPIRMSTDARHAVERFDPSQAGREYEISLREGETAGGKMMSDIQGGTSLGGRLASQISSTNSESARAMQGFNPNATAGLGETYDKLRSEGPTYEEDFYTSQLAGKNPAYEMVMKDAMREARNSAAARGGFVSGKAVENEQRTAARLAAEEFARRGELAGMAGQARRDRLGQQLEGAGALDEQLLNQRGLGADVALRREGMLSDLAQSGDSIRGNLAGQQDQLLSDLSIHQDVQGLNKLDLSGRLAESMDARIMDKERLRMEGSGQEDDYRQANQDAIDTIASNLSTRDVNRNNTLANLAGNDDTARTSRMGTLAEALGTMDTNTITHSRDLDNLSNNASTATFDREKQMDDVQNRGFLEAERGEDRRLDAADKADSANNAQDTTLINAGDKASKESFDAFKTQFDAAMAMGDKQSALDLAYDQLIGGNVTQAQIAAIDAEMAAAGIPLAQRNQFKNDAIKLTDAILPG